MIEKLRLFLVILEEGSLRRAAERLHISQSAITRQIQLLEHDLGGRVLERTSTGVRPTNGGHTLAEKARSLLADYDLVMAKVRRLVRGESDRLRIGYVASAVEEYLGPALAALRRTHPKVKVKMLDLTPGEMIIALRRDEIDLALTGHGADLLSRDLYTYKLASAIPPDDHLPMLLLNAFQVWRFAHQILDITKRAGIWARRPGRKCRPVAQQFVAKTGIEIDDAFCGHHEDWLSVHVGALVIHRRKSWLPSALVRAVGFDLSLRFISQHNKPPQASRPRRNLSVKLS